KKYPLYILITIYNYKQNIRCYNYESPKKLHI
ncbi:hypothetical protein, partial [Bacillus anthracis]